MKKSYVIFIGTVICILMVVFVSCAKQNDIWDTTGTSNESASVHESKKSVTTPPPSTYEISSDDIPTQLFEFEVDISKYADTGYITLHLLDATYDNLKCHYSWLDVHLFKLVDNKWKELYYVIEIPETEPPTIIVGEDNRKTYSHHFNLTEVFGDLSSGTYMIVVDARIINEFWRVIMATTPSAIIELPERYS